ncbi:NADPH-dependent FMN reductase [Salinisphaera hydrothermalis]|uniref:NADPH-dependent FMN reductase n=1 Tax=Salinisphaera hydrothermalis TaxID=563188 RepID=UPI003340842E
MPGSYLSLALILGSARYGRRCLAIADWAQAQLESATDVVVDRIDPQKLPLSLTDQPLPRQAWQNLERRIDHADAFVVITPEYNHGYPAALKQIIDAVRHPWRAKPVDLISYGGLSGGIRATEQLRQVFAELHAVTLADTVSIVHADRRVDAAHGFRPEPGHVRALATLDLRLRWWAGALADARRRRPYDDMPAGRRTA